MTQLVAPFPYFGGKRTVTDLVWDRFGKVDNYVEPFFGSGAVLLGSPWPSDRVETVNDLDGFLINFWRAVRKNPFAVAEWADDIASEADLSARHLWLLERGQKLSERLQADPDYCEAKAAGWWCWGACQWIGSGWCSGNGPWTREKDADGAWQILHLGNKGRGIKRQILHLGDKGRGIKRQILHLGSGMGTPGIYAWFTDLSERLRRVRVACGDWSRVLGDSVTYKHGMTGVFLDPPYVSDRYSTVYSNDSMTVANDVRAWALEAGKNKLMRIALCGYAGEHDLPGWEAVPWKAKGGYGSQGDGQGRDNSAKEVIWFSPHCLGGRQLGLF
jgi:DNA adenine methylase